jgi:hypothetical protein
VDDVSSTIELQLIHCSCYHGRRNTVIPSHVHWGHQCDFHLCCTLALNALEVASSADLLFMNDVHNRRQKLHAH